MGHVDDPITFKRWEASITAPRFTHYRLPDLDEAANVAARNLANSFRGGRSADMVVLAEAHEVAYYLREAAEVIGGAVVLPDPGRPLPVAPSPRPSYGPEVDDQLTLLSRRMHMASRRFDSLVGPLTTSMRALVGDMIAILAAMGWPSPLQGEIRGPAPAVRVINAHQAVAAARRLVARGVDPFGPGFHSAVLDEMGIPPVPGSGLRGLGTVGNHQISKALRAFREGLLRGDDGSCSDG